MRKGIIKKIIIAATASFLAMCFFGALTSSLTKDTCMDHEWDDGVVVKESTCYAAGLEVYTCEVCGTSKNHKLSKKAHAYVPGKIIVSPTCQDNGIQEFTCAVCQHTIEENVGIGTHSYSLVAECAPTPTMNGYEMYECAICKDVRLVDLEYNPTAGMMEFVPPNCDYPIMGNWVRVYKPSFAYNPWENSVHFLCLDVKNDYESNYETIEIPIADEGIVMDGVHITIEGMTIHETQEYIDFYFAEGEYVVRADGMEETSVLKINQYTVLQFYGDMSEDIYILVDVDTSKMVETVPNVNAPIMNEWVRVYGPNFKSSNGYLYIMTRDEDYSYRGYCFYYTDNCLYYQGQLVNIEGMLIDKKGMCIDFYFATGEYAVKTIDGNELFKIFIDEGAMLDYVDLYEDSGVYILKPATGE